MTNVLQEEMTRLCSAHRHGCTLALLFDYDGTLTPIVRHPGLARLDSRTRRLLLRLGGIPRVEIGVVSGRALTDLRAQVGLCDLYYAGTSGLELELRGRRLTHPEAESYDLLMQFLATRLRELTNQYPGSWVEDKRLGLTVHYRHVDAAGLGRLLADADELLQPYSQQVCRVNGPMAWEITPALCWNKGSALRLILEAIGPPVVPLYAGDGPNDAEALAQAAALGGVAVGIGPGAPASAQCRLYDSAALVSFLACLASALTEESTATVA